MKNMPQALLCLFGSELRIRILCHFFFHTPEEVPIRKLASRIGMKAGAVGRELNRMEKGGLLISHEVDGQKCYSLNKDLSMLEDLRNVLLKTTGASAELQEVLRNLSGVEIAFLYGSCAAGDTSPDSGIDLMVVGDIPEKDLAAEMARVEQALKQKIHYTRHTRKEAEKRLGERGDPIHDVFFGSRIMLVGLEDDALLRIA